MRKWTALLLVPLAALLCVSLVYAYSYPYYAPVMVAESNGEARSSLGVLASVDNEYLADHGYISSDGLDTRVTYASAIVPHMVADDKVGIYAANLGASASETYNYEVGVDEDLSSFYLISGVGGEVLVVDDDSLEPGADDFELEWKGYIDSGTLGSVLYKDDAYGIIVTQEEYTAGVIGADTVTIHNTTASDGNINNAGTDYNTVWSAGPGTVDSAQSYIGQNYVDPTYTVYRTMMFFDTSSIPDDAVVINVDVYMRLAVDSSVTDFNIVAQNGQPTYPHDPMEVGDYNKSHYSGSGSSYNTTNLPAPNNWFNFPLSSEAYSWIQLDGITKICFRSDEDINGNPPTESEFIRIYVFGAGMEAKLYVTYYSDGVGGVTTVGEHTLKLTKTGSTLEYFIDDASQGSITTADPPDNANTVVIDGDIAAATEFAKLEVNSVQVLWFQPFTIIEGTTLPDRSGSPTNDGGITWGSNPSGVSASVGGLVSTTVVVPSGTQAESPDATGEITPIGEMFTETEGTNLPLYDFYKEMADTSSVPIQFFWMLGALAITMLGGVLCFYYLRSTLLTTLTVGTLLATFSVMGIFPFWVVIVFAIIAATVVIYERVTSL